MTAATWEVLRPAPAIPSPHDKRIRLQRDVVPQLADRDKPVMEYCRLTIDGKGDLVCMREREPIDLSEIRKLLKDLVEAVALIGRSCDFGRHIGHAHELIQRTGVAEGFRIEVEPDL